jgi:hypothetical protein
LCIIPFIGITSRNRDQFNIKVPNRCKTIVLSPALISLSDIEQQRGNTIHYSRFPANTVNGITVDMKLNMLSYKKGVKAPGRIIQDPDYNRVFDETADFDPKKQALSVFQTSY